MKRDGYYILEAKYAYLFTEVICIDHLNGDRYCREYFESPCIDPKTEEEHTSTGWILLDGGSSETEEWMNEAYEYVEVLPTALREAIESRQSLSI